jgi:hypothetical protein
MLGLGGVAVNENWGIAMEAGKIPTPFPDGQYFVSDLILNPRGMRPLLASRSASTICDCHPVGSTICNTKRPTPHMCPIRLSDWLRHWTAGKPLTAALNWTKFVYQPWGSHEAVAVGSPYFGTVSIRFNPHFAPSGSS